MKIEKTNRGFKYLEFKDLYKHGCSLQESSLATDDAIWFGIDDADPQIMKSDTPEGGTGWKKFHIPKEVNLTTRMHLNREQVAELIPILQNFVDTGDVTLVSKKNKYQFINAK